MLKMLAFFLLMLFAVVHSHSRKPVYTQVTFLYDIKRGDLKNWGKRTLQYYLSYFEQLLRTDVNLIVFGNKQLEEFVWKRREQHNTVFVLKELTSFKDYWFSNLVEKARQDKLQQRDFPQKGYPQYTVEYYNILMFGKMYTMAEAVKYDKWNTDYLIWTDGGYMHQFKKSIIYPQNIVRKFYQFIQPHWVYITYENDVYFGYKEGQKKYINRKIQLQESVLASTMGGSIHIVRDIKSAFENVARITLENGDLNSDESVFTLLPIKYPFLIPTTTSIYLGDYFNKFHKYGDVGKTSLNPRYFSASIDLQRKTLITSNNKKFEDEQNINTSLQGIKHGLQAQARELKSFSYYKKLADGRIVYLKTISIGLLFAGFSVLFVQNRKIKKQLAQKVSSKMMIS